MSTPNYLFDFKNITAPQLLEQALADWAVTKLSDRAFELTGREHTRADLIRMWQCIGADGHIFIYDYEADDEEYHPRKPKGRRRDTAQDADLDTQTVQVIASFREPQGD